MDVSLLKRLFIAAMPSALSRTNYIVKHKLFASVGENFFFQPRIVPINAEYIKFGNNVAVASNVTFICHDVAQKVFNNLCFEKKFKKKYGCIEIGDNVFIGSNSTILYDVKIGSNCLVAAGSVIVKDTPSGSVVGGVPAKIIGSFERLYEKRALESEKVNAYTAEECWARFYEKHNK